MRRCAAVLVLCSAGMCLTRVVLKLCMGDAAPDGMDLIAQVETCEALPAVVHIIMLRLAHPHSRLRSEIRLRPGQTSCQGYNEPHTADLTGLNATLESANAVSPASTSARSGSGRRSPSA